MGLGLAGPVLAGTEAQRAQDLIDDAEYDQAARVLRDALSRSGLSRAELIELYSLQGTVLVALGRRDRAEAAFRNLAVADPGYELPRGTSPKVREVFEAVHKELTESGALDRSFRPEHTPVGSVAPGSDVTLRLDIGAADRAAEISKVQIFYRRVGTPHYSSVYASKSADGGYQGAVPGFFLDSESEDYAVEYYIEATDASENRLTSVGSSTLPLIFEVLGTDQTPPPDNGDGGEEEGPPWVTIGVIAGAVVVVGALVGVGVGAYILLNQQGEGSAKVTVRAP